MVYDDSNFRAIEEKTYLINSIDCYGGLEGHLENGMTMDEDKTSIPVISRIFLDLSVSLGYNIQMYRNFCNEKFKKDLTDYCKN